VDPRAGLDDLENRIFLTLLGLELRPLITTVFLERLMRKHKIVVHRLEAGYVYTSDGALYPLEWCDFQLYENGENGRPPVDYSFSFKAGMKKLDSKIFKAQSRLINSWVFFE
jgi:hypothetical protein